MIDKPSDHEHEYFKKLEAEQKKKLRDHLDKKREEQKKSEKHSSWMKCPKCGGDLEEIQHHDVAIDKCKSCSGVWLDAGELEILLGSGESQSIFGKLFSKKK